MFILVFAFRSDVLGIAYFNAIYILRSQLMRREHFKETLDDIGQRIFFLNQAKYCQSMMKLAETVLQRRDKTLKKPGAHPNVKYWKRAYWDNMALSQGLKGVRVK